MAETTSNPPSDDETEGKPGAQPAAADAAPRDAGDHSALLSEDNAIQFDDDGVPLPPQSPLEFLQQQLVQVEAERDATKDKMLRALAEGENIRRRAMKDREEGEKYGGVRLARDLLAVYDNLERALEAADDGVREAAPDFIEGVELTRRELLNAFAKHQIVTVSPQVGDKFDANRHQAMFESPAPGAENGAIIQVMQQGFTISDRLLRAAMVGVAKNPTGGAAPQAAANDDAPSSGADAADDTDPTTQT